MTQRRPATTTPSTPYLYALASSLAFATMGALSHLAGESSDWRLVATARTLLAFLFSVAIARSTGARLVFLRAPRALWVRSLAGSASLLCSFYAFTHLPVSTTVTLTSTVPVWVTLLAWPVLGQKPTRAVWLAVAVGLAGVVLVQRPDLAGDRLAAMLALASAAGTATAMIGLNRLGNLDARAVVAHFSGVSTVFALCALMLSNVEIDAATLSRFHVAWPLVGVGLLGTLGQYAMTRAFATGPPAKVSVVGLTQIVFALLFDLLWWRRPFDKLSLVGVLLVAAPSAWLLLHNPLRRRAEIHTTTA